MKRRHSPRRLWARLGITAKLGLAFALLVALIFIAAFVHYSTLRVVNRAQAEILTSMEIRQRVFEMDDGLEKARRLYRDFIFYYPEIGFEAARETYCRPLQASMDSVIAQSEELKELINWSNVSDALRKTNVNVNLYLSSARRFAAIFLELADLVTAIAGPQTGLHARQDALMNELMDALAGVRTDGRGPAAEAVENIALSCRKMDLLSKQYRIGRQRPYMQSVFNSVHEINAEVARSAKLSPGQKTMLRDLLDQYAGAGEKILDADTAIRSKVNDFNLQFAALDPISLGLKMLAATEVENARGRIDAAGRLALGGIVATSAFGLICALCIAWVVNASVTRKITSMTRAAFELRTGNLDARVKTGGSDELAILAESFNAMAERLKDLVENLEGNVRRRTLELAAKNKELDGKNHALEILSTTDRLTGINNRRKVEQALQAELLRAKRYRTPYSVILIDVDNFKQVNDNFGHPAGDAVLMRFAGILTALIRETDMAGRWGGEEFIVVCPESDLPVAAALAERLRGEIADSDFPPAGQVSASFGVAAYRLGDEVHSLIHRADKALYQAKKAGRNRVMTQGETGESDGTQGEAGLQKP
ncbi:MAG: diguanylate cyclase [Desulfovibrionaceae bacterium]|nr:diguanylate cyclase [Desulfovibrionaceae bacterium]MBF0512795.1 diguanylate cyclase [Desulfovibrionaceae bacterium]